MDKKYNPEQAVDQLCEKHQIEIASTFEKIKAIGKMKLLHNELLNFLDSGKKTDVLLIEGIGVKVNIKEITPRIVQEEEFEEFKGELFVLSAKDKKEAIFKIANWLMEKFIFLTINDELFVYMDGIYNERGEELVKKFTQRFLGVGASTFSVNEIIGHIKRSTIKDKEDLNSPEFLLPVKNGLLNLKTKKIGEYSPDYFFNMEKLAVKFDAATDCPLIKNFVSEVVSEADTPVIQEMIGYCLLREYPIAKGFMLFGDGRNGKSTLIRLIKTFLGVKNITSISLQKLEMNVFAAACLHQKLANLCADLSSKPLYETGTFKILTGEDGITAEKKFGHPFEFTNYAKLIFSANRIPISKDRTAAFLRRWQIIGFLNKFEEDDPKTDPRLIFKLTTEEELSGLLNWALKGLDRIFKNGHFSNRKSLEVVEDEWIRKSDPVESFTLDIIEADPDGFISKGELYQKFCGYCRKNQYTEITEKAFSQNLVKFLPAKTERINIEGKRVWCWKGIRYRKGSVQGVQDVQDIALLNKQFEIINYNKKNPRHLGHLRQHKGKINSENEHPGQNKVKLTFKEDFLSFINPNTGKQTPDYKRGTSAYFEKPTADILKKTGSVVESGTE